MTLRYGIVQAVTAFRIVCAVFIPFMAANGAWPSIALLLALAFLSDYFDGWLARRWNLTGKFGAFFDPLADKVVCLTMLWLLVVHFQTPAYLLLAIAITAYDITTTTLRLTRAKQQSMPASRLAKLKTALLMVGLLLAPVGIAQTNPLAADTFSSLGLALLAIAAVTSLFSLVSYIRAIASPTKTRLEFHRHISTIDFAEWNTSHTITTILFDIDGTLAPWRSNAIENEIKEVLQRLRQNGITHIGLVTNMSARHEQKIKQMARVVGADMYIFPQTWRWRKPSSQMIRAALDRLHASPEKTAFVGDKIVDVIAARRAKLVRVAWVERLGTTDHFFDKYLYRLIEPVLKWLMK